MGVAPGIHIREFRQTDLGACQSLYHDGLIGGSIAENDTGLDIDDISSAYMEMPGNSFWVADSGSSEVVGMIGVMQADNVGEIRRLRVHNEFRRRGIGSALLERALAFCQQQNCLKVTLDTFVEREAAIKLFEKFRFRHTRTRSIHDKELLYFYLDLYTSDKEQSE